jgi:hypothetical protein
VDKSLQADLILCSIDGWEGAWVCKNANYTERQMITAMEMAVGAVSIRQHHNEAAYYFGQRVKLADEKQWAFLCGLVLCEQAERIAL